jgi:hypothetical protein
MIAQQRSIQTSSSSTPVPNLDKVTLGAQILKVTLAYDQLLRSGKSEQEAMASLRAEPSQFEAVVVSALAGIQNQPQLMEVRSCRIADLTVDMVLQEDVRTKNGVLVVAKGQQITYPLLVRLRNFWEGRAISGSILVHVPAEKTGQFPIAAANKHLSTVQ